MEELWQKCPICEGIGKVIGKYENSQVTDFNGFDCWKTCPTCNGARIISKINGLPPRHFRINVTKRNAGQLFNDSTTNSAQKGGGEY